MKMKKGRIGQICVVVRDVRKTMDHFNRLLGVGPWDVQHFIPGRVRDYYVNGEKVEEGFDFICAIAMYGDMELEILQPVSGENIYWGWLERHGEGLHHFKILYDAGVLDEVAQELEQKDAKIIQTGWFYDNHHYYVDTEDTLGFQLELGDEGKTGAPDMIYPGK